MYYTLYPEPRNQDGYIIQIEELYFDGEGEYYNETYQQIFPDLENVTKKDTHGILK